MGRPVPTDVDRYFFDLQGFLILPDTVAKPLLNRLNAAFDRFPPLEVGEWWGNTQRRDYTGATGFELHNCIEADPAFEELVDNPSWIDHAHHFAGEVDSYVEGLFLDESVASIRGAGGHHPVHSGGHHAAMRTAYGYENGVFRCGQVNVLLALSDIGPGDGPTMVIPGSHKSNLAHPLAGDYFADERMDALPGAIPVHLNAGDALLFVDALMHGAASRTNDGQRRLVILRYGPSWAATRFGYEYSADLLARVTPERRAILQPIPPRRPPGP
jgi:ectoine hydroxylase-related dioxygenase (phytanoyl-CoA dioxygenase family)